MSKTFKNIDAMLESIQKDIEENINGYVSFSELFNQGVMNKNSDFATFEDLLTAYDIEINCEEDFENLDEQILDDAISKSSKFSSWKEMYETAANELFAKKLRDHGYDIR